MRFLYLLLLVSQILPAYRFLKTEYRYFFLFGPFWDLVQYALGYFSIAQDLRWQIIYFGICSLLALMPKVPMPAKVFPFAVGLIINMLRPLVDLNIDTLSSILPAGFIAWFFIKEFIEEKRLFSLLMIIFWTYNAGKLIVYHIDVYAGATLVIVGWIVSTAIYTGIGIIGYGFRLVKENEDVEEIKEETHSPARAIGLKVSTL